MREVLLRLIDDSRFSEFKPEYGRNLITGWAHFYGKSIPRSCSSQRSPANYITNPTINPGIQVGIIANQMSVINPTEAAKGAQFIRMCNQQ